MHVALGLGVADDCCRFGTVAFAFVPSTATNFVSFISECLRIKFAESIGSAPMDSASKAEHDLARWLEECQVGPGGRWISQFRMWSREPSGKGLLGDPPTTSVEVETREPSGKGFLGNSPDLYFVH